MVAMHLKPVAHVRSMRKMPLIASVHVDSIATPLSRLVLHVAQEQRAQAGPVGSLRRYQIVEVKNVSPS